MARTLADMIAPFEAQGFMLVATIETELMVNHGYRLLVIVF